MHWIAKTQWKTQLEGSSQTEKEKLNLILHIFPFIRLHFQRIYTK